ncbi:MAG: hypothetical protein ACI8WP_001784, partial [Flavobacteriaceae bacterium]
PIWVTKKVLNRQEMEICIYDTIDPRDTSNQFD